MNRVELSYMANTIQICGKISTDYLFCVSDMHIRKNASAEDPMVLSALVSLHDFR